MDATHTDFITQLRERLERLVGAQPFRVWFKNTTQFTLSEDYLKVGVPNLFVGNWIEAHYAEYLLQAVRDLTAREVKLFVSVDPQLFRQLRQSQLNSQANYIAKDPERQARDARRAGGFPPARPLRARLEEFVVGPSNELAYAAAIRIVEGRNGAFGPLFIHGGCGLGKTHLLQGVHNALCAHDGDGKSLYVSGEEFTNQFVYALKLGKLDAFRHRFRCPGVLVIDDVHFLANKRATQEEFLHTFNTIDASGQQVVMASDTHPKLIGQFSESLVNRFLAGMVVRIDSPDLATRLAILRRKATHMKQEVPEPVMAFIAEHLTSNVRELEGALIKLVAYAGVSHEPLTIEVARRLLDEHLRLSTRIVRFTDIETMVATYFALTPPDLHTSRKARTVALARGIAMYLARRLTGMSYPEIGRLMGNKNHSTVILACRRIDRILSNDDAVGWQSPMGFQQRPLRELLKEFEGQLTGAR